MTAWVDIDGRRSFAVSDEPEWHSGGSAMRGYPDVIRVQACPDCGLRVGQEWQDCPATGFQHAKGEVQVYVPREDR